MKSKIIGMFCCLAWVFSLFAQVSSSGSDTTIYNLRVPKKWDDPAFIYQLTGLIEKNIPLLKDKRVCLNCPNTPYDVLLVLVPPKIVTQTITNVSKTYETKLDHYEYSISFSFMASLIFVEKANELSTNKKEIVLIDSLESHTKSKIFSGPSSATHILNIAAPANTGTQRGSSARMPASSTPLASSPVVTNNGALINYADGSTLDTEKFKQEHEKAMRPDDNEIRHIVQNRVLLMQTRPKK